MICRACKLEHSPLVNCGVARRLAETAARKVVNTLTRIADSAPGEKVEEGRTALYRHFASNGVLLYVGISLSAINRLSAHVGRSNWAKDIARVEVVWYETRDKALKAELSAIQIEGPQHNIVGKPKPQKAPRPGRPAPKHTDRHKPGYMAEYMRKRRAKCQPS